MKILTKNFLNTSAMVVLIITIAFCMLYFMMPDYYQKKKEAEIEESVSELVKKIEEHPRSEETRDLLSQKELYGDIIFVLKDKKAEIIYPDHKSDQLIINLQGKKVGTDVNSIFNDEKTEQLEIGVPGNSLQYLSHKVIFGEDYSLQAIYPLQPINEAQQVLLAIYPVVLTISFIIGGMFTFVYSYFGTKRIKLISTVTKKMTESSEVKIYQIKGNDEIKQLSEDINYLHTQLAMTNDKLSNDLEVISDLENYKTEFMQIASHELKTPVTALTGIIEGMIHEVGPYKDKDKYLKICQTLLQEQTDLIKDILDISKIDHMEESVATTFLLNELIEQELSVYQPMIMAQSYRVKIQLESIEMVANKEEFRRVISNLISNAVNYTPSGGTISIRLTHDKFQLSNECLPLKEKDLERVFEAFYRPDFARNKKDGGTGLGLFIVSQLLGKTNFTYDFQPVEGSNGMVFTIYLS